MSGRVRGVDANRRIAIDRGWEVAPSPAGAIDDPKDIDGLDWIGASVPTTAAAALRAAKRWSWDDNRRFDAEDWWWRVRVDGEPHGAAPLPPYITEPLDAMGALPTVRER